MVTDEPNKYGKTYEGDDLTYYDGDGYPWRGALIAIVLSAAILFVGVIPWCLGAFQIITWIF